MGTPRTVWHGIDQSVETDAALPSTGNHGARCVVEETGSIFIYDANDKKWKPDDEVISRWSFTTDGGGVGWYDLGTTLPAGTIIMDGVLRVLDPLQSSGAAKIGIKAESAAGATKDILADVLISTAGVEGVYDITPDGTAANAVLLTSDKNVKLNITVAALTAGVFELHLRCLRGGVSEEVSSSSSSSVTSSSSSSSSVTSSSSTGTSSSSVTSSLTSSSSTSSVTSSSSDSSSSVTSSTSSVTSSSSSVTSSSSSG